MSKNFLVVDDSSFMRDRIKKILSDAGYNIIAEAKDGMEAIELYEQYKPDFVTMDITMRGMNGIDASREIITKHGDAKIIIISVTENDDYRQQSKEIGVLSYLQKNKLDSLPQLMKEIDV